MFNSSLQVQTSKISNTPVQPLTTNSVVSYLTEKIRTTRREFLQTTTATSTNLTKYLHSVLVTVDEPWLLACTLGSSLRTYTLFQQTFLSLLYHQSFLHVSKSNDKFLVFIWLDPSAAFGFQDTTLIILDLSWPLFLLFSTWLNTLRCS